MATRKTIASHRYALGDGHATARLCQWVSGPKAGLYFAEYYLPPYRKTRQSMQTRDEVAARAAFSVFLEDILPAELVVDDRPVSTLRSGDPTLAELCAWYVDTVMVARGNAEITRQQNRRQFAEWVSFCAAQQIDTVSELAANSDAATAYVAALSATHKPSSVRKAVGKVRAALRAAQEAGIIESEPVKAWNLPKPVAPSFAAPITPEEFRTLIDRLENGVHVGNWQSGLGASCYLHIVRFLAYTGCRPSDACALTIAAVDLERRTLRFRQSKTSAPTVLRLSAPAVDAIRAAMSDRTDTNQPVFLSPSGGPFTPGAVANATIYHSRKAGLRKVTPKAFRIAAVTYAVAAGHDAEYVRALTGHESRAIRSYVRLLPDAAYDLAEGLANRLDAPTVDTPDRTPTT